MSEIPRPINVVGGSGGGAGPLPPGLIIGGGHRGR